MKAAARASFLAFTDDLEGVVATPYLDLLGLWTIARGVLGDPIAGALALPLRRRATGVLATRAEIAADFLRLKQQCCWTERPAIEKKTKPKYCHWNPWKGTGGRACLAHLGWKAAAHVTTLYLTDEDVDTVTWRKVDAMLAELRRHFPSFDRWPADAQLGTLALAWAVGANLPAVWPRFSAACRREDWETAERECIIPQAHGTIPERNRRMVKCFRNARLVQGAHLDGERLYWPIALTDDTPTVRDLDGC